MDCFQELDIDTICPIALLCLLLLNLVDYLYLCPECHVLHTCLDLQSLEWLSCLVFLQDGEILYKYIYPVLIGVRGREDYIILL